MLAVGEDELLCDMAETYHIYNLYDLPVEYASVLAYGLRNDSRIKMKMLGLEVDVETLLLAHIADNTALNLYAKTKDAKNHRNRPKSIVQALTAQKEELASFKSGEDFMKEWRRINGN